MFRGVRGGTSGSVLCRASERIATSSGLTSVCALLVQLGNACPPMCPCPARCGTDLARDRRTSICSASGAAPRCSTPRRSAAVEDRPGAGTSSIGLLAGQRLELLGLAGGIDARVRCSPAPRGDVTTPRAAARSRARETRCGHRAACWIRWGNGRSPSRWLSPHPPAGSPERWCEGVGAGVCVRVMQVGVRRRGAEILGGAGVVCRFLP